MKRKVDSHQQLTGLGDIQQESSLREQDKNLHRERFERLGSEKSINKLERSLTKEMSDLDEYTSKRRIGEHETERKKIYETSQQQFEGRSSYEQQSHSSERKQSEDRERAVRYKHENYRDLPEIGIYSGTLSNRFDISESTRKEIPKTSSYEKDRKEVHKYENIA